MKRKLFEKTNDLSALPEDVISEIKKLIRDGASDRSKKWANALELVHAAYKAAAVQRPTPDMESAWKQYEEMISYAIDQLAKYRGIDGDWRMTSLTMTEQAEGNYIVAELENRTVNIKGTVNDIIRSLKRKNVKPVRVVKNKERIKLIFKDSSGKKFIVKLKKPIN